MRPEGQRQQVLAHRTRRRATRVSANAYLLFYSAIVMQLAMRTRRCGCVIRAAVCLSRRLIVAKGIGDLGRSPYERSAGLESRLDSLFSPLLCYAGALHCLPNHSQRRRADEIK